MTMQIRGRVQVNVPYGMLRDIYLDYVLENGLNPEIGLDAETLDTVPESDFRRCAELLARHGRTITFHAPFFDLSAGSIDSEIRKVTWRRFEQMLKLVPLFRPGSVVCHAGYESCRHGYMREQWIENSVAIWRRLSESLSAEGSLLVLENVFESFPEDLLPLFERLNPDTAGFCLDVGHQAAFSRAPLDRWLRVLGPFLKQVHLHDNHRDGDDHLAMGAGQVDFTLLFDYFRAHPGRRPLITLEPHVAEDLWPSLSYLEANWPW